MAWLLLARSDCGLHVDELLGRIAAGAGAIAYRPIAAARRICLPELPHIAAGWGLLEMQQV